MGTEIFSLAGKVAIVTGAARGLGAALAQGLAEAGARVVLGDLNEPGARETAERIAAAGGEAAATRVEVADPESCDALVRFAASRFGRVDVLVNNAGIDIIEPVGEVTSAAWQRVVDVDARGVLNASQSAVRQMQAQGSGGAIVSISSIAAFVGIPGLASYSAAKGGVNLLTKVMAVELAPKGIRVNAIAPGYFATEMTAEYPPGFVDDLVQRRSPLGRTGELEECAAAVVFLASDASSYITGAVLPVDGGLLTT